VCNITPACDVLIGHFPYGTLDGETCPVQYTDSIYRYSQYVVPQIGERRSVTLLPLYSQYIVPQIGERRSVTLLPSLCNMGDDSLCNNLFIGFLFWSQGLATPEERGFWMCSTSCGGRTPEGVLDVPHVLWRQNPRGPGDTSDGHAAVTHQTGMLL
jgi:hypothetical protein